MGSSSSKQCGQVSLCNHVLTGPGWGSCVKATCDNTCNKIPGSAQPLMAINVGDAASCQLWISTDCSGTSVGATGTTWNLYDPTGAVNHARSYKCE